MVDKNEQRFRDPQQVCQLFLQSDDSAAAKAGLQGGAKAGQIYIKTGLLSDLDHFNSTSKSPTATVGSSSMDSLAFKLWSLVNLEYLREDIIGGEDVQTTTN